MRTFWSLTSWRDLLAILGLTGVALAEGAMVGCGGNAAIVAPVSDDGATADAADARPGPETDGSSEGAGGDAGGDSTVGDDGNTASDSSSGGDSPLASDTGADDGSSPGSDAGACGADDTACMAASGPGLCKAGACSTCSDTTDDGNCSTAYGSPQLCLAGACSPGNCRSNADCATNPAGGLCGVSTPNQCGKCTSDSQCAAASSATPVCDTHAGQCAVGSCPLDAGIDSNPPPACPVNPSDMCCSTTCQPNPNASAPAASMSKACCGTGPLANAYCSGVVGSGATCQNNVCTACPAPTSGQYTVDPTSGSDATGTGSATPGCALKTITRALQIIGTGSIFQNTITVLAGTVGPGETFPIVVPQNVSIVTAGGAVNVNVPAGTAGFLLVGGASGAGTVAGISGGAGAALTISGQNGTATFGIVATTGSSASTQISNLRVSNFLDDGILVENSGVLSIRAGVVSTSNGTANRHSDGLHVTDTGHAIVTVPAGQTPAQFDANTSHGIFVTANGYVTITGAVTSIAGIGTVTANGNSAAGLWIEQSPGSPPQNVIAGLVSFGSKAGNGMRFVVGSSVKLRSSVSLGNNGSGVVVSGGGPGSADLGKIDLGNERGPDYGNNTLQNVQASLHNTAAGLCLQVRPNSGTLLGAGNTFGSANCATFAGTVSINRMSCSSSLRACMLGVCDLGISAPGNDIDVKMCSHR